MATKLGYRYVTKAEGVCGGEAIIQDTRIPVWLIFARYRAGQSPEEIRTAHPHLSLSQVHGALAYAFDHTDEILAAIDENRETHWRTAPPSTPST